MDYYSASGIIKYDVNKDGNIESIEYNYHTNVQVNQSYKEFELRYAENVLYLLLFDNNLYDYENIVCITAIGICDVDKTDEHLDFVVTEAPRGRIYCRSSLYSLKDDGLKKYVSLKEEILGVSGDGKVYYWGGNLMETHYLYFKPDYVISYFDTKLMEYVSTDQIIGKSLTGFDYNLVFESPDQVPYGSPVEVTMELPGAIRKVKEGEKVTILDYCGDTVKIQSEDGLIGWIGGFHMVWD